MADLIRDDFMRLKGRVTVLPTAVPAIVAFKKAATMQVPVHWIDPVRAGHAMHQVLWELIPSLQGRFAPNHRDHGLVRPEEPLPTPSATTDGQQ